MTGQEQRDIIAPTISIQDAAQRRWDAVVVGAGPAGALAARALALAGREVLLIDKARFPRTKACGCCLSGAAIDTLHRAGLAAALQRLAAAPLSSLRLHAGSAVATVPSRGLAVSRAAFDAALIREAIRAGAAFLPETAGEWRPDGAVLRAGGEGKSEPGTPILAGVTLVCDGLAGSALRVHRSSVAPRGRVGLSAVLDESFESGVVRMACGPSGYVGAVALEDGRLNVAAAIDPAAIRASGGPSQAVSAILASCRLYPPAGLAAARWHGAPALTRSRSRLFRPGLVVLGDAAGYVEPFTGEGIGWALAGGLAAANLVLQGQPERWPLVHTRLIARRQRACRAVASLLRCPTVSSVAIRALALLPAIATPALDRVHRPLLETAS